MSGAVTTVAMSEAINKRFRFSIEINMKRRNKVIVAIAVLSCVFMLGFGAAALSSADRIRSKFKRVQSAVTILGRKQIALDGVVPQITEFKKSLDKGDAVNAEKLLDQILARKEVMAIAAEISREPSVSNRFNPPIQASDEPIDNTFSVPRPTEIQGYSDHMMEPCITLDGKYLMFNNSNEPGVKTHIQLCQRLDTNIFKYIGELPGTVSDSKDMAPSVDNAGNLYYTSLKTYDQDLKSLYVGKLKGEAVTGVQQVAGDISPKVQTWINMDCCVSADGKTLVVSRARFDLGSVHPAESDLQIFMKGDNGFALEPHSNDLLKAVNTPALEYAPSLSADQLELYFTRAQRDLEGRLLLRILVSKRDKLSSPFGPPSALGVIQGFVEAPTLPALNHELFFHKRDAEDGKFKIYRCERTR
jgi:hypothetical protein